MEPIAAGPVPSRVENLFDDGERPVDVDTEGELLIRDGGVFNLDEDIVRLCPFSFLSYYLALNIDCIDRESGLRNCSPRLNDGFPIQDGADRVICIDPTPCRRADDRPNSSEQIGAPA